MPPESILVFIPGRPVGGEYECARYHDPATGRTTEERATPLLALVELFPPDQVIALCTPEGGEAVGQLREWANGGDIQLPPIEEVPIELPQAGDIAPLINKIAALDLPAEASVHLDITFGARSLMVPALLTSLVQSAARRWNLQRLTYVNFVAHPAGGEDAAAVVEDLTAYLGLPRLAYATRQLKERADLLPFLDALAPFLPPDQRGPRQQDLQILAEAVEYLRIDSLLAGQARAALGNVLRDIGRMPDPGALLGPLLGDARTVLAGLTPPAEGRAGAPAHLAALVRWYRDHGRPERALLIATESIPWLVCRRLLQQDFPILSEGPNPSPIPWRDYFIRARQEVPDRLELIGYAESLRYALAPHRHRFAHAEFGDHPRPGPQTPDDLLNEFERILGDPGWNP